MSDPIRAITKIRNNRLMEIRESLGKKPREMAVIVGTSYQRYLELEGLRHYPSEAMAVKIATALGESAENIFPGYLKSIAITTVINTIPEATVLQLSAKHMLLLTGDARNDILEAQSTKEVHRKLNEVLNTLTPREQKVLEMRFGLNGESEHTLDESADRCGCSRERVRQIEAKAIRKLRHPTRSRHLVHYRPAHPEDQHAWKFTKYKSKKLYVCSLCYVIGVKRKYETSVSSTGRRLSDKHIIEFKKLFYPDVTTWTCSFCNTETKEKECQVCGNTPAEY